MKYEVFFSIIFFVVSLWLELVAYHNIDLAINMSDNLIDENMFGVIRTKKDVYFLGIQGFFLGLVFQFIGYFLLLKESFK